MQDIGVAEVKNEYDFLYLFVTRGQGKESESHIKPVTGQAVFRSHFR